MKHITYLVLLAILCAGVFVAGCSDTSSAGSATPQPSAATTTAATGPLYSAGDIVKNPKSTSGAALLIISYDAGTDMYERAYVYPNADGSWGYRLDSKADKTGRAVIEKVYPEKATRVTVSAIPVRTPTTIATPVVTTVTTTATATTTTSSHIPPRVKDITPSKGTAGTTVSITELEGEGFLTGATVSLNKTGETGIMASSVTVKSPIEITCSFAIPSNAPAGYWDVVVRNTDGQFHRFQNGFNILAGTGTTTTTTTTAATSSTSLVKITSLSPSAITLGGLETTATIEFIGTNFSSAYNSRLTKSGSTITGSGYYASSATTSRNVFTLPATSAGTWSVSFVDSSGNVLGTLDNALTVNP